MRQVDTGLVGEAEQLGPLVDAVDAQHVAERVEVDVARLLERVPQVHRPVAARQVALEVAAVEGGAPAAVDPVVGRHHALFEGGDRDDDLEGGSRRVAPLDGPVLQGPQRVGVQPRPGLAIDARGEAIGVVGRQADERQDLAGTRVEHDGRAPVARGAEAVLHGALQVGVDGESQAGALGRRALPEHLDLAADAVDHHPPGPVLAHQAGVVDLFHARLSDDGARRQALVLRPGELRLGDLADVAEEMRGHLVGRVVARRHLLHEQVGELEAPGEHRRHVRVVVLHGDRRARIADRPHARRVIGMGVVDERLRCNAGQRRQRDRRGVETHQRQRRVEIADMRPGDDVPAPADCQRALELAAERQYGGFAPRQRQRCQPPRQAQHLRPPGGDLHDRVVQRVQDGAVVQQKAVGDAGQVCECLVVVGAQRLARRVAAGGDHRKAEPLQQQHVQRGARQHGAKARIARRKIGRQRVAAAIQQHNGRGRRHQQRLFGRAHAAHGT